MAKDLCDFCNCPSDAARSQYSFWQFLALAICNINEGIEELVIGGGGGGVAVNTVTAVPSSATAVTLAASNAARRSLSIFNDSSANLYVKHGSGASISGPSFTTKVLAGQFYELSNPIYTGIVTGIWASANGNALVTEG